MQRVAAAAATFLLTGTCLADQLRMWTANCAGAFDGRRIGRLADGYEASFIAFTGDPLKDFAATRSIALRVKDGRILELGPPPPEPPED